MNGSLRTQVLAGSGTVAVGMVDLLKTTLRRFARDQWVRIHGTPRVTVIAGDAHARELWQQWLGVSGIAGSLVDGNADFESAMREALRRAGEDPRAVIAVLASAARIAAWRAGRADRIAALVDEGFVQVREPIATPLHPRLGSTVLLDARSAAEAALFEALEATPATAGRFELNGLLAVRFGPSAAEIDLLDRGDRIAIEIDGYHHFTDPECYRRDRRKDLLLQTQGLLVIRLLAEDVLRDARDAVTVVCRALAYRMGGRET